jgi:hypothetical protein
MPSIVGAMDLKAENSPPRGDRQHRSSTLAIQFEGDRRTSVGLPFHRARLFEYKLRDATFKQLKKGEAGTPKFWCSLGFNNG